MDKFWNYSRVADEGQERGRECCHLVIAVLTWPRVVNFFFLCDFVARFTAGDCEVGRLW